MLLALNNSAPPAPATDLQLDAVPGLPTKRDPPEQLDLCWNKRSGAAHRWQILQSPHGPTKPRPKEGGPWSLNRRITPGLAHRCQYYKSPRTEMVRRGTDSPRYWMEGGAFAQLHWMGGGMTPYQNERAGEWRPKILDGRASTRPRRLQDRLTPRPYWWQKAVWHRVVAEGGSWAAGQSAEGCEATGWWYMVG